MKTKEEFDLSTYRFEVPDGVFINVKYVKEFIRRRNEIDKEIILWARMWAEHVDDEEVFKMWETSYESEKIKKRIADLAGDKLI